MEKTDQVLSEAISKVSSSLESMVVDYGADTVELALTAVRLGALREVAIPVLFLVLAVPAGFWFAVKLIRYGWREDDEDAAVSGMILSLLVGVATFIAMHNVLNLAAWSAVFGYPEVYLAYKALVSVGVM